MPKRYPDEFKRDVVAVARRGDLTDLEVATGFGVAEEGVRRWMRQDDIDEGIKDGMTSAEQSELVRLRREKRRLEIANEILRRAAAYFASSASFSRALAAWTAVSSSRVCHSRAMERADSLSRFRSAALVACARLGSRLTASATALRRTSSPSRWARSVLSRSSLASLL